MLTITINYPIKVTFTDNSVTKYIPGGIFEAEEKGSKYLIWYKDLPQIKMLCTYEDLMNAAFGVKFKKKLFTRHRR